MIVVDPVGEVEGVGLVVLCLLVAAMRHLVDHGARHDMAAVTTVPEEADTIREGDTGDQAREDGETGD